jgi:hypothetical protein
MGSAWAYAAETTWAWCAETLVRPLRKKASHWTGASGFFSRKGRLGDAAGGIENVALLGNRLEAIAISRLLDGIEVSVRPAWVRAVNTLLANKTIHRLNQRVGQFYTINELSMELGNVPRALEILHLECMPTPLEDLIMSTTADVSRTEDPSTSTMTMSTTSNSSSSSFSSFPATDNDGSTNTTDKPTSSSNRNDDNTDKPTSGNSSLFLREGERAEDLVRVVVQFHYTNTLQLQVKKRSRNSKWKEHINHAFFFTGLHLPHSYV